MASVCTEKNGVRVQFVAPCGTRKSLRLGPIDMRSARSIARHVDNLSAAKRAGQSAPADTRAWLNSISTGLRNKLASHGLADPVVDLKLGAFLEQYILARVDVKPATLEVWRQPCRNLLDYFGKDRDIRSITPGDADQFKQALSTSRLASATLAKRLAFARTFFHTARKHRFIDENPFADVKASAGDISQRQAFISRETVDRLLAAASPTWRTIIALSRFGGLRCPSEVLSLEWRHVDWASETIQVPAPKTERYDGKSTREIPIFAALKPHLLAAFEQAAPGQTHVVAGDYLASANTPSGWRNCNLRTAFTRLIKRAGLKPWPRIFHNLRSSCETELLDTFPAHVVAAWLGHDAKVLLKHYAQVTDDHLAAAKSGSNSGSLAGENAPEFSCQQTARSGSSLGDAYVASAYDAGACVARGHPTLPGIHWECQKIKLEMRSRELCAPHCTAAEAASACIKTTCDAFFTSLAQPAEAGLAQKTAQASDELPADLREVVAAWAHLSAPIRAAVIAITRACAING